MALEKDEKTNGLFKQVRTTITNNSSPQEIEQFKASNPFETDIEYLAHVQKGCEDVLNAAGLHSKYGIEVTWEDKTKEFYPKDQALPKPSERRWIKEQLLPDLKSLEPLSAAYFATEIILRIDEYKKYLHENDIEKACYNALRLGEAIQRFALTFEIEDWALAGKKCKQNTGGRQRPEFFNKNNKERQIWQAEAKKIWHKKPNESKINVARLVARNLKTKKSFHTICRHIKKPD